MPYIDVLIHFVWSTKNRKPILTQKVRQLLFTHMKLYAESKGIHIDRLNGHLDHVHCLISLKQGQSIDKIVQLLKGESAHWLNNRSELKNIKLEWQDEYFAISVSKSIADIVRKYIDNQETHHKKKTFIQEYDELMKKLNFTKSEAND